MLKSMPGFPKLVQHLADYVEVFGIKVESDLTQSWKSTDLWWCQHYYTNVKLYRTFFLDSLQTARQKTEPLPYKLS